MRSFLLFSLAALASSLVAQDSVNVTVNAAKTIGANKPFWTYFGYDEPNYTTAKNGRKLIRELSDLSPVPVSIRVHNLLTTGNGKASLKWGSTNAYTEDANGKPVYDWTIVDGILDTFVNSGARPFVEVGFMPKALSTHPDPYQHHFPQEKNVFTGWAYPPNDYAKWDELIYHWAQHCGEKYGKDKAESWEWEVWNEPDIGYWHGTPEEYDKLYDHTVAAIRRALPGAKVGGPATTGPGNPKAAAFLRQFLEHCLSGKNDATGKTGAPLDFISFHAKGSPKINEGEVRMGMAKHMKDISNGFDIVRSFSKYKDLPIVLSESDPEGCAACSLPQNAYRNGTLYAVYMAASLNGATQLAKKTGANLEGFLTWAFEFEDQPYFAGLRSLATNGVDQPVLNVFRMRGMMRGDLVEATSDKAASLDALVNGEVAAPETDAVATRTDHDVSVMLWNYEDRDRTDSSASVSLNVSGLPKTAKRVLLRHFRIDGEHSNSYSMWKAMGSPQSPSADQTAKLEASGELQLLESPRYIDAKAGTAELKFNLPVQGISLVQLSW
ncbi:MAG: GH39 family glycosyl hydrolase [Bryobacteraceae bacterium]